MADANFERAFGSLAYAELEQKAPGLFPYLVGFQLVKKTDDETHAVGVFGFKVGDQWYYCPVFWLNGKIKGYDLLYIVSQDLFVPMQESWINYITNRQPYVMGDPLGGNPSNQNFTAPDLTPYTQSPVTKQSSVTEENWGDVTPMIVSPKDPRYTKVAANLDLTNLGKSPELAASLLKTMNGNTKFAEAVYKFYSPAAMFKVSQEAKRAGISKRAAENFISGNDVKVTVQYGPDTTGSGNMTALTAAQREQILRGDAVVEDNRKPGTTSEIYAKPDFERSLSVPNQSGLWDVLLKGSEFKQALVICDPVTIGAASVTSLVTVVVPEEDMQWVNATASSVHARARIDPDKWPAMFSKFASPATMKPHDIGMLVDKNFRGTIPFRVLKVMKGSNGITELCVQPLDRIKDMSGSSFLSPKQTNYGNSNKCEPCCVGTSSVSYDYHTYDVRCDAGSDSNYGKKEHYTSCDGHHIVLSPKAGGFTNNADTLTVNADSVKFLRMGTFEFETYESDGETKWRPVKDEYDIDRGTLTLGNAASIDEYLFKQGMHLIEAQPDRDDSMQITFRGKRNRLLGKNAALKLLIEGVGLREDDARNIVKHAKIEKISGLVKLAAPMSPATSGGYDSTYGAVTTGPSNETTQINSNAPGIDRQKSMAPIDPDIQRQAEEAAAAGQKDVFDMSVLNGLIRANDIEGVLQDMVKDIITGNDRIGRILFLYYWHFDQFAEKYGDEDMKELEDTLRNVFKSTGDLVLFLKQKSIEPGAVERATVDISTAPASGI